MMHDTKSKVTLQGIVSDVETQSAQALVNGFSFAAALAWLDVARWMVANLVNVPKSSGSYVVLSALLTTLVGVIMFMIVRMFVKVKKGPQTLAVAA